MADMCGPFRRTNDSNCLGPEEYFKAAPAAIHAGFGIHCLVADSLCFGQEDRWLN